MKKFNIIALAGLELDKINEAESVLQYDANLVIRVGFLNSSELAKDNSAISKMLLDMKIEKLRMADELVIVETEGRERAHEYLVDKAIEFGKTVTYFSDYMKRRGKKSLDTCTRELMQSGADNAININNSIK